MSEWTWWSVWLAGPAVVALLVALELRRASVLPALAPPDRRRARGAVLAFALAACGAPLAPAWVVPFTDFGGPLPVAEPENPHAGEPWTFDFGFTWELLLAAALLVVLVRVVPVVVAWFVGHRRRAAELPLPAGRTFSQLAGGLAGAVAVLAVARVAFGGVAPGDFTTHGALTPDAGAAGWRLDLVLVDVIADAAALRPLAAGPPLASELEWDEGNDCCGALAMMPGWHEVSGLKAWVGGRPVLIETTAERTLRWRPVAERDERDFPGARRPRFESLPWWAPAADGGYVLLETRPDGSTFAMRSDGTGSRTVTSWEVSWLLAAPAGPLLVLLLAMLAAFLLARRAAAGSIHGPVLRFAAAWILLEASAGTVVLYLPYV